MSTQKGGNLDYQIPTEWLEGEHKVRRSKHPSGQRQYYMWESFRQGYVGLTVHCGPVQMGWAQLPAQRVVLGAQGRGALR